MLDINDLVDLYDAIDNEAMNHDIYRLQMTILSRNLSIVLQNESQKKV